MRLGALLANCCDCIFSPYQGGRRADQFEVLAQRFVGVEQVESRDALRGGGHLTSEADSTLDAGYTDGFLRLGKNAGELDTQINLGQFLWWWRDQRRAW
ncbi:hypothetical protein D3C85_1647520 [compost metagenome]